MTCLSDHQITGDHLCRVSLGPPAPLTSSEMVPRQLGGLWGSPFGDWVILLGLPRPQGRVLKLSSQCVVRAGVGCGLRWGFVFEDCSNNGFSACPAHGGPSGAAGIWSR